MTTAAKFDVRHRSRIVADGPDRAAARAMLRAVGVGDKEFEQPFIGVANTASDVTPCNVHLDKLAERVKAGVKSAAGTPFEFGVLTVSDGISMGTEGMKASLVSRELIADSIELVSHGEYFDGLVTIAGCDKNLPGAMMAAARLNIPTVFLYSGTIMPGRYAGRDISIQDVFEAIGAHSKGRISDSDLKDIECAACPGGGVVRGDVYGQHHVLDHRGYGYGAAGGVVGAGGGRRDIAEVVRGGADCDEAAGTGDKASGHPDKGSVRKRDCSGCMRWAAPQM